MHLSPYARTLQQWILQKHVNCDYVLVGNGEPFFETKRERGKKGRVGFFFFQVSPTILQDITETEMSSSIEAYCVLQAGLDNVLWGAEIPNVIGFILQVQNT